MTDFESLIRLLARNGVEFILVGGTAVGLYSIRSLLVVDEKRT